MSSFKAKFAPEPKLGHASLKRQVAVIGRVSEQPVVYECDVGSKVVVIEKIEYFCERRNARTLAQIKFLGKARIDTMDWQTHKTVSRDNSPIVTQASIVRKTSIAEIRTRP